MNAYEKTIPYSSFRMLQLGVLPGVGAQRLLWLPAAFFIQCTNSEWGMHFANGIERKIFCFRVGQSVDERRQQTCALLRVVLIIIGILGRLDSLVKFLPCPPFIQSPTYIQFIPSMLKITVTEAPVVGRGP